MDAAALTWYGYASLARKACMQETGAVFYASGCSVGGRTG